MTAQILVQHPVPEPDFIIESSNTHGQECIVLDQSIIWESGFDAQALKDYISDNYVIYLDQAVVNKEELTLTRRLATYMVLEEDIIVGSYGSPLSLCLDSEKLGVFSVLEFELTMPSGKKFSYTWVSSN